MNAKHRDHTIQLLKILRRRALSYRQMLALEISNCPWRRLSADESAAHLKPGEVIQRKEGNDGLLRLRVVRAKG